MEILNLRASVPLPRSPFEGKTVQQKQELLVSLIDQNILGHTGRDGLGPQLLKFTDLLREILWEGKYNTVPHGLTPSEVLSGWGETASSRLQAYYYLCLALNALQPNACNPTPAQPLTYHANGTVTITV